VNRQPSPVELAAIIAAVEVSWPRPVILVEEPDDEPGPWRFSGRWWNRSATARRDRPWIPPTR
jgi:hypothetical protein